MSRKTVLLEDLMVRGQPSLDPRNSPDEEFELYSIPAYDKREPEHVIGSEVGSSKKLVEPGDLLLSRIVPHIRRAWVVPPGNGKRQIASGEWIVFRGASFEPRYLRHFVLGDHFHAQFMNTVAGVGGSLVRARPENVGRIDVSLPPLPEQKRIADILDKADAIRRKRQEAIDQFGALTESLFHEMFSHKLSSVRWTDLSDYLVELRYGTSSKSGEGGYTTLRIPNIVRGIIDLTDLKTVDVSQNELEKLRLMEGDVLFVRTNGNPDYVGRCAVFDPTQMDAAGLDANEIIYASYLIRARLHLDRLRPLFLQSLLQTPAGRRSVREKCRTSAGQYNINTVGLGALQVPVVAVEEQFEFETTVRSFRPVLTSLTTACSEADSLFNALVQGAFKGEV